MNAKQIWSKIKVYPLALTLFGLAILLAGWAYYRGGDLDDAESQRDTITSDNDQVSKNVADSINLDTQLVSLTADVAKLKAGLINPTDVIPNQQYFYDLEQSTGVQILDPTEEGTVRSKDPAEPSITTFQLSATGQWENIISFLYALRTGPHFMRFGVVKIDKVATLGGGVSDSQRLTLTLNVEMLGQ